MISYKEILRILTRSPRSHAGLLDAYINSQTQLMALVLTI